MTRHVDKYLALEAAATSISIFETMVVPGALQTSDYAAAVLAGQPYDAVGRRLHRDLPSIASIVIDESVLYRPYGGPDALRQQISVLLDMADRPMTTVQVLGMHSACRHATDGPFSIVYSARNTVGFVEHRGGGSWKRAPGDIRRLEDAFGELQAAAMGPAESRDLLVKLIGIGENR